MTAGPSMYTPQSDNLQAFTATSGVVITPAARIGLTLPAGTYYIPFGSSEGPIASEAWVLSAHMKWTAALAATITLEYTNLPATTQGGGQGPADLTDFYATADGSWIQDNGATPTQINAGGAGNSVTNTTIVAGGTTLGAVYLSLANASARRYRLKVVVTAPGILRVAVMGKD